MKKAPLLSLIVASAISTNALAHGWGSDDPNKDATITYTLYTYISSIAPTVTSQDASHATSKKHHKMILAAKEDASAFVGSQGQIQTAALIGTIDSLRAEIPAVAQATDLEVAEAILAY